MCEQCEKTQIDSFSRTLQHLFDPLTEERLKAALAEMERRKAELHCPLAPLIGRDSAKVFLGPNAFLVWIEIDCPLHLKNLLHQSITFFARRQLFNVISGFLRTAFKPLKGFQGRMQCAR